MQNRWPIALAAGAGALWLNEAAALTDQQRLERLERHVLEMERRLEASEAENAKLRAKLPNTGSARTDTAAAPDVKALDQKVKLIERKLEVEKEVSENTRKSAVRIEEGPAGFKVTSPSGEHQLRLSGYLQADGDFFLDGNTTNAVGIGLNPTTQQPNPLSQGTSLGVDKFTIRRARLQFGGTLFKYADFLIAPDFGGGQARLFDGWLDLHYLPYASLAAGKQKGPISLERLQSATALLFNERSYPTQLAPNRDIGVLLHGEFAKPGYEAQYTGLSHSPEFFSYRVGVFNGVLDNQAVQNSDNASFDNKSFEGRIFSHPFQHSGIGALEGLGFGVAGSYGNPQKQGSIPSLQSPGQNNILTYANTGTTLTSSSIATAVVNPNTPNPGKQTTTTTTTTTSTAFSGALSNGDQYRIYPQGYWYWGPFGLFGEYAWSSQQLAVQQTDNITTAVQTQIRTNVGAPPGSPAGSTSTTTVSKTSTSTVSTQPSVAHQTTQNNQAWQIAASYVLTGEDNTFQGVTPRHPFNPFDGHWGAFQAVARWSELDIDKSTFKNFGTASKPLYLFSDPRSSVQHATSWALGVNWWLNRNVKLMTSYEQTYFNGGAVNAQKQVTDRPSERVFFTRFQFSY